MEVASIGSNVYQPNQVTQSNQSGQTAETTNETGVEGKNSQLPGTDDDDDPQTVPYEWGLGDTIDIFL